MTVRKIVLGRPEPEMGAPLRSNRACSSARFPMWIAIASLLV